MLQNTESNIAESQIAIRKKIYAIKIYTIKIYAIKIYAKRKIIYHLYMSNYMTIVLFIIHVIMVIMFYI